MLMYINRISLRSHLLPINTVYEYRQTQATTGGKIDSGRIVQQGVQHGFKSLGKDTGSVKGRFDD